MSVRASFIGVTVVAVLLGSSCATPDASGSTLVVGGVPVAAGLTVESPELLRSTDDLRTVAPAIAEPGEAVHVVVEIPTGTTSKWQVRKADGALEWELADDGNPRVVDYLGYPGNYGIVPSTLLPEEQGGDGDPLDVLVLGPAVARGTVLQARPVAVLRLRDAGEVDDKILAVPLDGPMQRVDSLAALERDYPGVTTIVETWFTHYEGASGDPVISGGWGDQTEAWTMIEFSVVGFQSSVFSRQSAHPLKTED